MGRQGRRTLGRIRACRHRQGEGRDRATTSTRSTPEQLAQWKKAAEPLEKTWADNVRKVGVDPATAMKELKDQLAKYNAGY